MSLCLKLISKIVYDLKSIGAIFNFIHPAYTNGAVIHIKAAYILKWYALV